MARHVEELTPQIDEIALQAARDVYNAISHDYLRGLELKESARLYSGPGPMLRIIWQSRWAGGGTEDIVIMLPERNALGRIERTRRHIEHRLMREVFIIDSEMGAAESSARGAA